MAITSRAKSKNYIFSRIENKPQSSLKGVMYAYTSLYVA
jgi:hypothetical protein